MATATPEFWGWQGHDPQAAEGRMQWEQFAPKTWTEDDVDIAIECCGICGSDLHMLRSGWGPSDYPLTVGHEIIGRAVRVGANAEGGLKVGDRVGVGAQAASCLRPDCEECSTGMEMHCDNPGNASTFGSRYPDGSRSTGGYAEHTRVPSHFVFRIPDAIPSVEAAPMMCGGVTVYAPLVENGAGPGTRVGVVGIGGLGHFALLFAKALGCTDITAISRRANKKADAMAMGATRFIATAEEPDWDKTHVKTLDLIICTVSSHDMPLTGYLNLLRLKGNFIMVGVPEENIAGFNMEILLDRRTKIGGSSVGSPRQIRDMLELAAAKGIRPWVNLYPMKEANAAIVDFEKGLPRYRFVLQNEPGAAGK